MTSIHASKFAEATESPRNQPRQYVANVEMIGFRCVVVVCSFTKLKRAECPLIKEISV